MKKLIIFLAYTICSNCMNAQTSTILEPCYQGGPLLAEMVTFYKPASVPNYATSRDIMYTEIDNDGAGNLSCVYSNYTIFVDPSSSTPRSDAFNLGINCEHSYPQSKGASQEPAKSNMHHLFPCKENVNADRSNCPYDENPDASTEFWYREDLILNSTPSTMIDDYSEKIGLGFSCGTFEPRESVKGDIARAIFYFYTMYKAEADAEDPDFFDIQKDVLLQWHYEDPVDLKEYNRTNAIAAYQDDKANPFVLDSTLARRAFFMPDMIFMGPECFTLLPVELDYFNASAKNNSIHLTWQTSSEQDNDVFIVERSKDGSDFSELGTIEVNMNASTTNRYFFEDKNPLIGINYYRLKQVDIDGSFQYSSVESAEFNRGVIPSIYPNPTKDNLVVKNLSIDRGVQLRIINIMGQIQSNFVIINQDDEHVVNLENLSSGVYFLQIENGSQLTTLRFVKL